MNQTDQEFLAFSKLNDADKIMIIQIGIESFSRAWKFHICGLTTLKGAMHYVNEDSPALIDFFLGALNGSAYSQEILSSFLGDERCKNLADKLHILPDVFAQKVENHA